ncbi:MAG: acyl-CoA thioesterase, partial [Mycobacteriales bacterium]
GLEHQLPMPQVPPPESLPTMAERAAGQGGEPTSFWSRPRPIDVRYVGDPPWLPRGVRERVPRNRVWMRADGELPDDPLLHVCAVTYASDMTLLDSLLIAHGLSWERTAVRGASLDHAMWFHRPFRADEWLLYDQSSPSASGARGLARGELFTRDGRLCVSVVQEGLLRVVG